MFSGDFGVGFFRTDSLAGFYGMAHGFASLTRMALIFADLFFRISRFLKGKTNRIRENPLNPPNPPNPPNPRAIPETP